MKTVLYIIGIALSLFAITKLLVLGTTGNQLTEYDKGFIWGNVILLLIGCTIIFIAWKRKDPLKGNN